VLVILDSDHSAGHVREELERYAPLVSPGSYIHVQDGCIDVLPCFKRGRPGPVVAVKSFLESHSEFARDTLIEGRYMLTWHPYGWLRRLDRGAELV
jgi:cephalosporin hydroxylase